IHGVPASLEERADVVGDRAVRLDHGDELPLVDITGLKRISKPGLRVYAKANEVPKVLNGLGIALVSTSEGVITDKEARKRNVGGEIIAYVW
ncbi:30S ribosomal protein S8, partial [Streptomyces griseoaurantiacus]|uniref:30S ribosomal protein S8 n=1 Tax=Streptomyces griseoaurantiacus TaxID=68213 RepID=UPI00345FFA24